MNLFKTVAETREFCENAKNKNLSIGLVPTMGALHAGHASLIKEAVKENDIVIVSVFVNPTQFAPNEDLDAYPRTLDNDCALAKSLGANAVFAPLPTEMYPFGEGATWVEVTNNLTKILCGRSRPIHFRGVTTVVNKLFNITQANRAYFGQKDGQQAQIIRRMVDDLFMNIEIRIMPIVREDDGLAISSRNIYLNSKERIAALVLSKSLAEAKELVLNGEKNKNNIVNHITQKIQSEPLANIDYIELYSFPNLEEIEKEITEDIFIGLAVKIGNTRLIDNIVITI